jgi:hypothetical protein
MLFIKKPRITKIISIGSFSAISFLLVILCATRVEAASLSISPSSGVYTVGKSITVRVIVSSGGQSINAVAGQLKFSNDILTLAQVSKGGLITLWAQEPTYSNTTGTVAFQGVILNGYSGGAGTVLTLTFRAKAEGTAAIAISDTNSSVLLNNGQGTNVLVGTSGGSFSIGKGATVEPSQPAQAIPPVVVPTVIVTPEPPVPQPMATPIFTDYQSPLSPGDFVVVKGHADINSLVTITFTHILQNGATTVIQNTIPTTDTGTFAYVSDEKVVQGSTYSLMATGRDGQHTALLELVVKNSLWFMIRNAILAIVAIRISALLALLLLLLITGYLLYRNYVLKKHLQMAIDRIHELEQK